MTARQSRPLPRTAFRFLVIGAGASALAGCNALSRLGDVGAEPTLTKIQDPQAQPGYQPVSLPMPTPVPSERNPNSLWRAGSKAFFKDQRAAKVGDLLTVEISISDSANLSNNSTRTRTNSEAATAGGLFGYESELAKIFPEAVSASNLVNTTSSTSNDGKGVIKRSESIALKLSAVITQLLPNGNMVIQGHQEVRVNFELRDLTITGVIRPEDVTSSNTISYEKIAEARISYGGRGQMTDVQQPRYGTQLFDIIMPF
jgi:flagellar L-ring protein FlgH